MYYSSNLSEVKKAWGPKVATEVKKLALQHELDPKKVTVLAAEPFDPSGERPMDSNDKPETYDYEAEYRFYRGLGWNGWERGWKRQEVRERHRYTNGDIRFPVMAMDFEMDAIKHQWEKLNPGQYLLGVAIGLRSRWELINVDRGRWDELYVKLWVMPSLEPQVVYDGAIYVKAPKTETKKIFVANVLPGSNLCNNLDCKAFHMIAYKLFGNASLIHDDYEAIIDREHELSVYNENLRNLEWDYKEKLKKLTDKDVYGWDSSFCVFGEVLHLAPWATHEITEAHRRLTEYKDKHNPGRQR